MNKYLLLLVSALLLNINSSFAQKKTKDEEKSKLIAGPMLSYIDNYHAQMWLLVSKETKEVTIKMENFDEDRNKTLVYDLTDPKVSTTQVGLTSMYLITIMEMKYQLFSL